MNLAVAYNFALLLYSSDVISRSRAGEWNPAEMTLPVSRVSNSVCKCAFQRDNSKNDWTWGQKIWYVWWTGGALVLHLFWVQKVTRLELCEYLSTPVASPYIIDIH